jgi:hypothetical protein
MENIDRGEIEREDEPHVSAERKDMHTVMGLKIRSLAYFASEISTTWQRISGAYGRL